MHVKISRLEPIAARIKEKRSAIVCPVIDHISAETMSYFGSSHVTSVGGFWWALHFRWDVLPVEELQKSALIPVKLVVFDPLIYTNFSTIALISKCISHLSNI